MLWRWRCGRARTQQEIPFVFEHVSLLTKARQTENDRLWFIRRTGSAHFV